MMFSAELLAFLVYGALGWCALTSITLVILVLKEWRMGKLW